MTEYIPSPSQWVADQVELYEGSNGTEGLTLRETGLPVIIVTNTGHKTGAVRKTPLMRVADGSNYVLVASKGGAAENPGWYLNLVAQPEIEIQVWGDVLTVTSHTATVEEKARLWPTMTEQWPDYDKYQRGTSRDIPLVVLSPRAS